MAGHSGEMTQDLTAILVEVRGLRAELDRFKDMLNDFAARTTNEIDFEKVDKRPTAPGKNQACAAKMTFRRSCASAARTAQA